MNTKNFSDKNNRLGRGLDILLGSSQKTDQVILLDIEKIETNKEQPRKVFDKNKLEELSDSIKKHGILQAILVQKQADKYQIIAGERRWRASCMAGLHKIPAIVKMAKSNQSAIWALIENIQREDLSSIEEARAFKKILEENNFNQEFLAQSLGRSRSSVANSLRLLQLDESVQALVESKKLSFSQAREILRFKTHEEQRQMANKCLKQSLTIKNLRGKSSEHSKKKTEGGPFWLKKVLLRLEKKFSKKLQCSYFKGRGRLSFSFQSEEELKHLLDRLISK